MVQRRGGVKRMPFYPPRGMSELSPVNSLGVKGEYRESLIVIEKINIKILSMNIFYIIFVGKTCIG